MYIWFNKNLAFPEREITSFEIHNRGEANETLRVFFAPSRVRVTMVDESTPFIIFLDFPTKEIPQKDWRRLHNLK